jgi:plasmid stability protein
MQELTIKLDDPIIEALRARAQRRGSSVEEEIRAALLNAFGMTPPPSKEVHEALGRKFEELHKQLGGRAGKPEHDSVKLIRAYRDAS